MIGILDILICRTCLQSNDSFNSSIEDWDIKNVNNFENMFNDNQLSKPSMIHRLFHGMIIQIGINEDSAITVISQSDNSFYRSVWITLLVLYPKLNSTPGYRPFETLMVYYYNTFLRNRSYRWKRLFSPNIHLSAQLQLLWRRFFW